MIDFPTLMPWLTLALAVIALGGHAKNFVSSDTKELAASQAAKDKEFALKQEAQEKKLIEHDRRIQTVENEMRHLPNRETTHQIEITMQKILGRLDAQDATLTGRFEAMDERLKPIQAIGERLQDVLVENARNKG